MATQKPLIISALGQVQRLPTSDTLDLSTLGTGTPNATTFLRGDGSWAVPSAGATSLALSSITAATIANTISNGDNAQLWQWALTSIVKSGLSLSESVASINGGSSQVLLDVSTLASSTATPFRVSALGVEAFRVHADGRVGIGTNSPSTKLTVNAVTNAGVAVNDGTVNTIIYNSTGGVSSVGTTTNHPLTLWTNNTERVRIDAGGDVTVHNSLVVAGQSTFSGTGSIRLPNGTDAQRPTPALGMIRYSTTSGSFEGYTGAGWGALGGGGGALPVTVTGTGLTAVASNHYVATAVITITLPASAAAADTIMISNFSSGNVTVARNGLNIMALAEDMTIDVAKATVVLKYIDATRGWIVIS